MMKFLTYLNGNKRKIIGGVMSLLNVAQALGFIPPETAQTINLVCTALFGAAQVDSMLGYPGRP